MRPVSGRLLCARVITLLSCLLAAIPYAALARIGQLLLSEGPTDRAAVMRMLLILLYAFLTQAFLYVVALVVAHFGDLKLRNLLQERIIEILAGAPLAWFSDTSTGQVRKAVQEDTAKIHTLVAHAPVEQTAAMATPFVLWFYLFTIDWRLALLSVATFPLYLAAQMFMMRDMGEKTAQMDEKLTDISSASVELIEGITVVKNFGHTGRAHGRFRQACQTFIEFYWDWCGSLIRLSAASIALISSATVLAVSLGGGLLMAQAGWVSVPQVLVATLVALIIPRSIEIIGMAAWSYQQAGASALRVQALLETDQITYGGTQNTLEDAGAGDPNCPITPSRPVSPTRPVSPARGVDPGDHSPSAPTQQTTPTSNATPASDVTPASKTTHEVVFEDVSYAYDTPAGRVQALSHISLRIPAGQVTALVGPSGSGKSTLATMLARFRDPNQGRITIGGVDLASFSEAELYQQVSFVLQNPYLQHTSLRELIRLARPDASDATIKAAAQKAQIWEDIAALPRGLDTVLGDETDFSGGQKQRLAIARALVADAPIVVLDEATTATDPDCAAEIQSALASLARGRTVLVIAHHAEAVRGANQIVILVNGQIQVCGSAQQLSTNPYWSQLEKASQA